MNGSGCKNCPVKPCETMNYRGSACAAQRAKFGLGDPQNNADRIRSMTDEELADNWMRDFVVCHRCAYCYECECDEYVTYEKCKEGIVEWLRQTAEEDE